MRASQDQHFYRFRFSWRYPENDTGRLLTMDLHFVTLIQHHVDTREGQWAMIQRPEEQIRTFQDLNRLTLAQWRQLLNSPYPDVQKRAQIILGPNP